MFLHHAKQMQTSAQDGQLGAAVAGTAISQGMAAGTGRGVPSEAGTSVAREGQLVRSVPLATSKSYSRAIKNYKEWANGDSGLLGPNKEIVTPARLFQFLQYIDEFKRKTNGERYSFSFYEQHVSSVMILYEEQRQQHPVRPEIQEDLAGVTAAKKGEWVHPRDANVKEFLRMVKDREYYTGHQHSRAVRNPRQRVQQQQQQQQQQQSQHQPHQPHNNNQHQPQPQPQQQPAPPPPQPPHYAQAPPALHTADQHAAPAQPAAAAMPGIDVSTLPTQQLSFMQFETRLCNMEEHLRMQADSITRTNALLSLYHNDLRENGNHIRTYAATTSEKLRDEVAEVKKTLGYLVAEVARNHGVLVAQMAAMQSFAPQGQPVNVLAPHAAAAAAAAAAVQPMPEPVPVVAPAAAPMPSSPLSAPLSAPVHPAQPAAEVARTAPPEQPPAAGAPAAVPNATDDQDYPVIRLRDHKFLTLEGLWDEYIHGYDGQPSLKAMELKYRTKWRINGKNNKTIMRRLKVGHAIEKTTAMYGQSVDDVIKELNEYLDSYTDDEHDDSDQHGDSSGRDEGGASAKKPRSKRLRKKKSTYWLSENLPAKFV